MINELKRTWHRRGAGNARVLAALLLLALVPASAARGETDVLLTSAVGFDNNVSNAARGRDIENEQIVTWGVLGSWTHALSDDAGLDLRHFHEFDALDNAELSAGLNWRMRTGISYRAPVVSLGARVSGIKHNNSNNSNIRDGGELRLTAAVGSRLTDRVRINAGYRWRARRATEDSVWDLEEHRTFANLDLQVGRRVTLYTTVSVATGEVVSTATPEASIIAAANHISRRPDDVFGPGDVPATPMGAAIPLTPISPPVGPRPVPGPLRLASDRFAYQVDADSVVIDTGVSLAHAERTAVDIGVGAFRTWAEDTADYDGHSVSLTLLHRMGH